MISPPNIVILNCSRMQLIQRVKVALLKPFPLILIIQLTDRAGKRECSPQLNANTSPSIALWTFCAWPRWNCVSEKFPLLDRSLNVLSLLLYLPNSASGWYRSCQFGSSNECTRNDLRRGLGGDWGLFWLWFVLMDPFVCGSESRSGF